MSSEQPSDREIVEALRRGEEAAFDLAFDRYRPRIFGFLARLSGRRDVAEDLLQETFLRLAAKAGALRPDTDLRAWLFAVARNLFISHRRALIVDLDRVERFRLFSGVEEPAVPTPFEALASSETERRLETALAGLPAKYREVVLLCGVERMSPSEAAAVLKLKPDAVRQRLSRARGMMKAELEGAEP
jgi:RNA polymerase sigma-70 factor (ECF subfamily)